MRYFDLEEERVKQEILKLGAKRVLIQLPEGLKPEATRIAKMVDKAGALPMVSADPCYGACDLTTADIERLGIDLTIHYGHSKMVKYERVPTIYVEARATVSVGSAVERAVLMLEKWQKIGLVTTVQHVQVVDYVREMLTRAKKTVVVGDTGRLSYPGQVIGCDYSNAKSIANDVDAFLFVGGGQFHAVGVALATLKPTIVADPYDNRAFSIDREAERISKQRWAAIEGAEKAKAFAVLVGLKPGQERIEKALQVKEKLEKNGRSVFIFVIREITPEALMEFPNIDAYVNTACPRVTLDDASRFKTPILTVNEVSVVVGELSWEELCRRGFTES